MSVEKNEHVVYNFRKVQKNGVQLMANFTKTAIRNAFLKLLDERSLSKITVKDITDECRINRNSFYYHYQDIPSLLSEIVAEDADEIIAKYPKVESIKECLNDAISFALEHKRVVKHIFDSVNRDILERYLMRVSEYVVTTYINTTFKHEEIDEKEKSAIIRYYKCTLFGIVVDWMNEGMNNDIIEEFNVYMHVRSSGIIEKALYNKE